MRPENARALHGSNTCMMGSNLLHQILRFHCTKLTDPPPPPPPTFSFFSPFSFFGGGGVGGGGGGGRRGYDALSEPPGTHTGTYHGIN
jgi:hypothetical protein